jgi:uncharacterized protein (TIGR03083 family)
MDGRPCDHRTMKALRDEAFAFTAALRALPPAAWDQPTRCAPWRVRDLVGHVVTAVGRVPETLAGPPPTRPDTTAVSYYRPDDRFGQTANADRVRTGQNRKATADDLAETATAVLDACRPEPPDRVVRTRHGDAMLLSEFLITRVVELALHGLDVADAVGREPWLTASAADCLQELLFGPGWRVATAGLGWNPPTLLRKTTGRAPITEPESADLATRGLRSLTLG